MPRRKTLPEALSIPDVAAILDVHHRTVRRWIALGYIEAYRIGPVIVRIPRSEVARMRKVRMPLKLYGDRPDYPRVVQPPPGNIGTV